MITASGTRYVNMSERLLNIRNRHFLVLDIILLALAPPAALVLRAGKAFALMLPSCHGPDPLRGCGPHRTPGCLLPPGYAPEPLPG